MAYSSIRSNGKWWYPGLTSDKPTSLLYKRITADFHDKFIVCRNIEGKRSFAYFDTYLHYLNYKKAKGLFKVKHYEVLLEGLNRLMFFDIDISRKKGANSDIDEDKLQELTDTMVENIIVVFSDEYKIDIGPENILFHTSHGDDKYSFHVLVDGYYMLDHHQCRYFYDKLIDLLPDWIVPFIDFAVYSKTQQVRLLGSHSSGDRVKKFVKTWNYKGNVMETPDWDTQEIFEKSLVGYIEGCKRINPKEIKRKEYENSEEYEEIDVDKTIAFCQENMKSFPFKVLKVIDQSIVLKRLGPSHCDICKTKEQGLEPHRNENPYVTVHDGFVRFNCRRDKSNRYQIIGNLEEKCLINFLELNLLIPPGSGGGVPIETRESVKEKEEEKKEIKENAGKLVLNGEKQKKLELVNIIKDASEPLMTVVEPKKNFSKDLGRIDIYSKRLSIKADKNNERFLKREAEKKQYRDSLTK